MDKFTEILKHAHSGLRYVVLALILIAIVNAMMKRKSGAYSNGDRKLNLFAMISVHVQLLIGLVLYSISGNVNFSGISETVFRFYSIEHAFGMLLAVVLVTIAHAKSKKMEDANKKHRIIMLGYLFALIIIFATIPWPFRDLGGKWF